MNALVLHKLTNRSIERFVAQPSHALLLVGPPGIGKSATAEYLVNKILKNTAETGSIYENHPYARTIQSDEGKAIPIEAIRELQQFMSLTIPGSSANDISRAVVIEDAHLMSVEAQNALLKTLEEPSHGTLLILCAPSDRTVLDTIRSRTTQLAIHVPEIQQVREHFETAGYDLQAIEQALKMTAGLPGLTALILQNDTDNPLAVAATHARGILRSTAYERLQLVDSVAKQKQLCLDIMYVMARMSRMAIEQNPKDAVAAKWLRILEATTVVERQLAHSTQSKLVLTSFMLTL